MARPKKKGLDYFPLDVDIFGNEKLFDVQNDYGPLGEVIYIRLLCLVYKNGYYYQFESLDKLAAMMIRSIGNRWARDKKTVKEVILYLAEINLFSAELMQRNVITSRSIQERYLLAVERRQSKIEEYSLLEECKELKKSDLQEALSSAPKIHISSAETTINAAETPNNVSDNPTKKSKEKESKSKYMSSDCKLLEPEQRRELEEMSDSRTVGRYIQKITDWQSRTGKKCRDPYSTIRDWIAKDNKENRTVSGNDSSYDLDEFEDFAMNFSLSDDMGR